MTLTIEKLRRVLYGRRSERKERLLDLPETRLHELLPWHWRADRQQALAA